MFFSARGYFTSVTDFFLDYARRRTSARTIYRLSSGGLPVPDHVRDHNANMRFATQEAADRHRAHPLDLSRIVPMTVSAGEYRRLFKQRRSKVADLRTLPHVKATRLRVR